jgi:hypothetical protein
MLALSDVMVSMKHQFYSLWLDPIEARTHHLPHFRKAR